MNIFEKIILISIFFLTLAPKAFALTYSDSDVPLVFPRSVWETKAEMLNYLNWTPEDKTAGDFEKSGINPNSNDAIPDYLPIERIVIHDTGCSPTSKDCNSDAVDSKDVIGRIYRNHAVQRGWGDLGYNYIIDRQGNIYEGRFGGNGVRGAHVYDSKRCLNFNTGSVGISVLGNYENAKMPDTAFNSLAMLIGWLSASNNLTPSQMDKTSTVWENPKINGKCSSEYGSFSHSFTGPVILGHKDIEPANSDPGTVDMAKLRTESQKWKDIYASYSYKIGQEQNIFSIEGGVKKTIATTTDELYKNVKTISATQADIFPDQAKISLPEGSLIKSRSRPDIFLVEQGKRRLITSYDIFKQKSFSLSDVKTMGDRELMGYALGKPVMRSDGELIASEKTGKVYLVKDGKKRYVIAPWAFSKNGLKEKNIIKVSDSELGNYPDGGIVGLPEGSILTDKKRKEFYMVADGGKKKIGSWNLMLAYKFNKKKDNKLSQKDLDAYPDKGYLMYPDNSLVQMAGDGNIYLVRDGKARWIQTYDVFKQLGYKISNVVKLPKDEFKNYALGSVIGSIADLNKKTDAILTQSTDIKNAVSDKKIRIAITEVAKTQEVKVTANGEFDLIDLNGGRTRYKAGQMASIAWTRTNDVRFETIANDTILEVLSYENFNWDKSINFNKFRGMLSVKYSPKSQKVWIVNELVFEEYLQGIGEALNTDEKEYQKAFAISSRSYAIFHLEHGGKYGADEIFHLNNTSSDQVYKGYNWETHALNLVASVKETAGEVMKYNGKVARSVYSSDSGGVTKNACNYFGKEFCSPDYGYLIGGVNDPEGTQRRNADVLTKSHGVGMSSTGARRLAQLGKTYQEILKYYYIGINVEKVY